LRSIQAGSASFGERVVIYALLVAKGGPKLKESAKESTDDAIAAPPPGGQRMDGPDAG